MMAYHNAFVTPIVFPASSTSFSLPPRTSATATRHIPFSPFAASTFVRPYDFPSPSRRLHHSPHSDDDNVPPRTATPRRQHDANTMMTMSHVAHAPNDDNYNSLNSQSHSHSVMDHTSSQSNSYADQYVWRQQNAALVAEATRNGIDSAIDMLWSLSRNGEAVSQNFNQVVSLLASRGRFADGLELADKAGKLQLANIITFRPLMKLCCTLGDGRGAKRVWKVMNKWNISGDMFIYAELMGALVRSQDMTSAYRILDSLIDAGKQPNIILYNTLMKEFARRADVQSAFETVTTIEKAGMQPDETTFNTLLNTCVRATDVDSLQRAIQLMNEHRVRPGTPTFNTILKLYSRKGKFDHALTIFDEMQQSVSPSIVTYNTLIDGCAHRGDMFRASEFLERMIQNGFSPDICTLTSLLKGFGRANDPERAVQLFEGMMAGGYCIEERTKYAIVNACLRGGDRVNAKRFLLEMLMSGLLIRTKTWTWMLESDVHNGNEEGALESLRLMYSNGTYLSSIVKAKLIREARNREMHQLSRQLKAARTGEPRR